VYPVLSKGVNHILNGRHEIEIDLERGEMWSPKTRKTASLEYLCGRPLEIFNSNGICSVFNRKVEEESKSTRI
jgi:hypothetical protein